MRRIYLDANKEFTDLFDTCLSKGMICCGYTLHLQEDGIAISSKIKLFKEHASKSEFHNRKAEELQKLDR